MSEPSSASARRIVDQVASLADGQREAAIERACAGDSVLRAQVDALLRPRSAPGMDAPTLDIDAGATDGRADGAALIEGPGARIGPYKILELIGEGGFGSVFLAEQEKPVRRMVALKIIKLGMDTRQVVARFEQERQALAMMDHPNIARVLDAGATGAGRPFFVMELVRGEPITGYCDKQNIDIRGRLRLFTQVCNAVQHAHTKGVIHRDIKPSNVLVSLVDGAPSVKVIDFGIAKATSARLTDRTVYTEQRSMVGTPEYMSPEQAEGSLDIDTRTDVYSLGVLLYELLTGTTPFESDQLRSGMQAEVQRIIREVDPLRPSARLARESGTRAAAAERRRISPASLTSLLKGELDWIAMKAMEKDRTRRYETARGLGLDVERFLEGQPVSAAPPGAAYQIGKFVKRNRVGVVAGGLVALALVLGVAGTTVGLVRATAQRRIAEANAQEAAAQAQRASDAEREATVRLQESEATVEFLDDMLGAADPTTKGKDVTVRAILDEAAGTVGARFGGKPRVAARLHATIGRTYMGLGVYDAAERHVRDAYELRVREQGADDPETCKARNALLAWMVESGAAEAEETIRAAIAQHEKLFGRGAETTLASMEQMVLLLSQQSRAAEAVELAREVLAGRILLLGEDHELAIAAMNNLATVLAEVKGAQESERLFERAIAAQARRTSADHPNTLGMRSNLAWMLYWTSMDEDGGKSERTKARLQKSRTIGEETLAARRRVLGEEHPETMTTMANLATVYRSLGMLEESEEMSRRELEASLKTLGEEHPETIVSLSNYANALRLRDRCADAIGFYERALVASRKVLPPDNLGTAYVLAWNGTCLGLVGRFAAGEASLKEGRSMIMRLEGDDSRVAKRMADALADHFERWEKAEPGKGHAAAAAEWRAKGEGKK